jgi:hypothetical protein
LENEFWKIKSGTHKIQVKIMKNWSIIETKETSIKVE